MAAVEHLHPVELLQLHVVAFGVEDKDAVVGEDPLLRHQPDNIAFPCRGRSGDHDPALASGYPGRGCVVECAQFGSEAARDEHNRKAIAPGLLDCLHGMCRYVAARCERAVKVERDRFEKRHGLSNLLPTMGLNMSSGFP
ncbi:hypothetical protein MGAST_09000 [Mycobacterium gastri 'Wayne']|uniref:Uncharacterized protein n=1 Tax=Mycobacterium gastri TaxID=1777 RepID=A0A1X1V7I6_MYCGS|nr:hypothetical protein MGAST_09000 [Mycobacterium gastri 'Wayne']ORV65012.1 hypothetical protein AWC07_13950 [Mycobacterium gastri]